jgi:hypothetical protein
MIRYTSEYINKGKRGNFNISSNVALSVSLLVKSYS